MSYSHTQIEAMFPPGFSVKGGWLTDYDIFSVEVGYRLAKTISLSGPRLHLDDKGRVPYILQEISRGRAEIKAELYRLIRELEKLEHPSNEIQGELSFDEDTSD
jgi:hypothetical protein